MITESAAVTLCEPPRARGSFDVGARAGPTEGPNFERRKQAAVLAGRLAVIVLVAAAVVMTVLARPGEVSAGRLAGLVGAALAYLACNHFGTAAAVRLLLAPPGARPGDGPAAPRTARLAAYFALQLGLAGLMHLLAGPARWLMWLVLLPPVAHGVMLLPRAGTAAVSAASTAVLVASVAWFRGWDAVPEAVIGFSLAVLFTLVFTQIAVSAEKARGEVARLAGELTEANRRLGEYAVQAGELAAARERNRLAREVHDSLGHYLTAAHVHLEAARAVLGRDPAAAAESLDKAGALTRDGLNDVRRSVAALRASPLDGRPLAEALRQVVDECRAAGLAAGLAVLGEPRPLPPAAGLTLYRAGQEGLTNTRKHARATAATLELDFRAGGAVRLRVSDDGAGPGPGGPADGFGLQGVRERARLLGGAVHAGPGPGGGFVLEVEVPG